MKDELKPTRITTRLEFDKADLDIVSAMPTLQEALAEQLQQAIDDNGEQHG